ncbi:MAG: MBL fold metallo-hydrolase [Anaerolineae bacterium]
MNVTVLGASSVAPNPGGACTGFLVQTGGMSLLLDCGVGVVSNLQRYISYHALDAVVISHMHSDHCLDLVTLRYCLKYAPWSGARRPIPLFLPPGGRAMLEEVIHPMREPDIEFFDGVFDICEYDPDQPLTVGPWKLSFTPTVHYVPCWAVRIESGERILAFSADTGPVADLLPISHGAHLFICEAAVYDRGTDTEQWGHLSPEEAATYARNGHVDRLVLSHTWHGYDRVDMVNRAAVVYGGPTSLAEEGQVYQV